MQVTNVPFSEWSYQENNRIYVKHSDWSEMLEAANWKGEHSAGRSDSGRSSQRKEEGGSWSGTSNFQEAYELATTGWDKIIKDLKDNNNDKLLRKATEAPISTMTLEKHGSYVNIGRYLAGQPDCMVLNTIHFVPKKIDIIIDGCFSCQASPEEFARYGKKILEIIDYCEKNKIRTAVKIRFCIREAVKLCIDIDLKKYGEFLDLNGGKYPAANKCKRNHIFLNGKRR